MLYKISGRHAYNKKYSLWKQGLILSLEHTIWSCKEYLRIVHSFYNYHNNSNGESLGIQTIKDLPAIQETQVLSLGWEDPLEKRMVTYSSILAWEIPRTEEPERLQPINTKTLKRPNSLYYYSQIYLNNYTKSHETNFCMMPLGCRLIFFLSCNYYR